MTEPTTPAAPPADAAPAVKQPLPDQADMTPRQLAEAILARQITRPRITSVRRLAEALLGKKKMKARKKAARKAEKKVRKLARIPGNTAR